MGTLFPVSYTHLFGVENLRAAFNQVKVLKENGYGEHGEYVGLDVKAMRTTTDEDSYKHLENSLNCLLYTSRCV